MRYFFHVQDGVSLPDDEGTEIASLEGARLQAVQAAGAFITDHASQFWAGEGWSMVVADADGLILFTLDFVGTMSPAAEQVIRSSRYAGSGNS